MYSSHLFNIFCRKNMSDTLEEHDRKPSIDDRNIVDSRYLEIEGTHQNTSRYPYFDISDLQT